MAEKPSRPTESSATLRRKKSFQGHQYRRKSKPITEQYKADLSKVLGLTVKTNCAFDCNEATGNIAFPAGCLIVICQVRKRKEFHIFNPGHKSITCLRFSIDGQYIVTGESGHLPCVRVFSVTERSQLAQFQSHKYGISCVAFSPNSQYIVSVGYQHDNVIHVWNWRKSALAATNKVSIKVRGIAFSENSSCFVTVGNRHVKFWYIEDTKVPDTETVPLKGRSGLLGNLRQKLFCDVACGVGSDSSSTYVLSRNGMLCQFDEKRTVTNSMQLETSAAYCISVVNGHIVCGCGEGKILIHSTTDLSQLAAFISSDKDNGLHDTIAVSMDSNNMWVHCVHADHTVKVWDVLDYVCPEEHLTKSFHSDCIWDIKVKPPSDGKQSFSFYSCSNDATVKQWVMQSDNCELKNNIPVSTVNQLSNPSNPKNGQLGIRSLCVSTNANLLAVGDRNGSIHMYQIEDEKEPTRLSQIEMHSGDILCLAYDFANGMLASASRDRYIHILDANHTPTYTINDHSAAVTSVQFAYINNKLKLISCGVDKSLYFCTVEIVDGKVEIVRDQHIVEKHAMHDMTIVNDSVVVACGGNLREYDIDSGKSQRCIRGCEGSSTIIRVSSDSERNIIATSCADKFLYLLNYLSGEVLLELSGHSEVCTALAFLNNGIDNLLITASADSCIFSWKLTKCAKFEDVRTFQPRLSCHAEDVTDECSMDARDMNMTAYFGEPHLNGTLIGNADISINGENWSADENKENINAHCNVIVEDEPDVSRNLRELDTSLPTWLTGQKDKIIKCHKPTGKWASRCQDQYLFLDTPCSSMDWDDINEKEESSEGASDKSDDAEDSEDMLEVENIGDRESAQDQEIDVGVSAQNGGNETVAEIDQLHDEVDSSIKLEQDDQNKTADAENGDINNQKCENGELRIDEKFVTADIVIECEDDTVEKFQPNPLKCIDQDQGLDIGDLTMSTEYASAREDHGISSKSEAIFLNASEEMISANDAPVEINQSTAPSEDDTKSGGLHDEKSLENSLNKKEKDIPPAFADFIESLTKRKRRTPNSLQVRSTYELSSNNNQSQSRNASDTANVILSSSPRIPSRMAMKNVEAESEEKKINLQESPVVNGHSPSKDCRNVVDNLMAAYEQAESMYHKISEERNPKDEETCVLLQSTFKSLKSRINHLQIETIARKSTGDLNLENLLREYSEKLCSMVSEEFKKKALLKE